MEKFSATFLNTCSRMVRYSQSPILRRTEKVFFEFLSIVQLPIAFFGSQLVLLINYAIGLSTLNE